MLENYRGAILANAASLGTRTQVKWADSSTLLADLSGDAWASQGVPCLSHGLERISHRRPLRRRSLAQEDRANANHEYWPRRRTTNSASRIRCTSNLAVDGTNGGARAETKFPAKFEVDDVRVRQK